MTDLTVPPAPAPDPFAEIAHELHAIADDFAELIGSGLPKPTFFQLNIQPGTRGDDISTAVSIDLLSLVLLDREGAVQKMGDGSYFYKADGRRGPLTASLYQSVSMEWAQAVQHEAELAKLPALLAKREAELAEMQAEVARLRTEVGSKPSQWFVPKTSVVEVDRSDILDANGADPVPAHADGHAFTGRSGEFPVITPAIRHAETSGWKGEGSGTSGVECLCGVTYDGFDSLAEAKQLLAHHIEAEAPLATHGQDGGE